MFCISILLIRIYHIYMFLVKSDPNEICDAGILYKTVFVLNLIFQCNDL